MKKITEELITEAMENGFTREDAERGYGVFTSDYGNGAEHIQRLDCMMIFDSDDEAAEQAEKTESKSYMIWNLMTKIWQHILIHQRTENYLKI